MIENDEDLNPNKKRLKCEDFSQNKNLENNMCLENSFSTDNSLIQETDQQETNIMSKIENSDLINSIDNDKDLSLKLKEMIKQKAQIKLKKNKRHMKLKKNNQFNQNCPISRSQQYYELSENSDSDVPLDDIDDMLEEGLKESLDKNNIPSHEERKKVVLKKREQDYFEMLPEGWIEVTHFSGMPVYLHKISRVCTLAKPYYLGSGSTRKHEIPVSAIPCLAYKKELEKEKELNDSNETKNNDFDNFNELEDKLEEKNNFTKDLNKDENIDFKGTSDEKDSSENNHQESLNNSIVDDLDENLCSKNLNDFENKKQNNSSNLNLKHSFIAKVETVKDNKKKRSLNYMTVREYCEKVFEFQEITIRKFKTWADRRNHMQQRKLAQRPSLPEGTKLITCPLPVNKEQPEIQGRNMRKEFVMNPAGKSSVCILHEFVQHAERVQPKYVFQELENANTPYSATVIINNMQYGTGYGSSKKQAKSEAAKATLEILIPDMKDMTQNNKKPDIATNDLSFFDDIKVEDPRVSELCAKAGQHSPYQILVECLRRNCGMGDTDITTNVRLVKHQKNEFTMKVGNHVATVICRNKREGKQRAAQAILQLLHPQITNWGSLLRLYGRGSCKTPKEKKEEEQKITELQNTACANKPNYAILNKLREEMLKLKTKDNSTVSPFSGILGDEQQLNVDDLLKK